MFDHLVDRSLLVSQLPQDCRIFGKISHTSSCLQFLDKEHSNENILIAHEITSFFLEWYGIGSCKAFPNFLPVLKSRQNLASACVVSGLTI